MITTVLSLLTLAVLLMLAGAVLQWRRGERRKAVLLVILALVAGINVAIWTVPYDNGEAPVVRSDQTPA
ncbi:MAG: hypothetical protein RL671_1559 [Pseudomonadota bacterium]|jgi:cytochrome c biogenesis factor|uniref:hypothetical protein n=1 Tax=Novosphingobium sp. APW14 TaxID=3077237 RepID=UPI0028DF6582|nr:hypothetical protein [Novosphingobium sp. APW14]MDT9011961.1 hypothetical protein [Novosphingobium sp. APW14]